VEACEIGLDQDFWGEELDGVEFTEAEDVFVEWR
jgi:hypothetical protein